MDELHRSSRVGASETRDVTARVVLYVVATVNAALATSMLIPCGVSLAYGEDDWRAFLLAMALTYAVTLPVLLVARTRGDQLRHREDLLIVAAGWSSACLFCALPFWFFARGGTVLELAGFTNCFFESASGLTTTGASVLSAVESLPHGILWWRSIIQWYGGMGIIVFTLALLPQLGVGGLLLYRAELPGPTAEKSTPRLRDTAVLLWKLYALISLCEVAALCLAGMSPFDSFCHTFTTMATGGFSTRNAGVIAFADRPGILLVLTCFMVVAGTSFSLHALASSARNLRCYAADVEFRVYLATIGAITGVVALLLIVSATVHSPWSAALHALFTVVSLTTTTGYASADFERWAMAVPAIGVILFLCLFVGGMSGSTGGAIKTIRHWLVVKAAWRELKTQVHPRGVFHIKVGNRPVADRVIQESLGFVVIYVLTFLVGTTLVSLAGGDVVSSASAVASCLGNVGPGFGTIGPTETYAALAGWVKWLLSGLMIVGRLEIYTVYVLLLPMVRRI